MFNFNFLMDFGNYKDRVVARVNPEENNGIGLSTAFSSDEGYETAILDAHGAHPVERYATKEEAKLGHKIWLHKLKPGMIVKELSLSDSEFQNQMIKIVPVKNERPGHRGIVKSDEADEQE